MYPKKEDALFTLIESMFGGTSTAIENQEKRGQNNLVVSEVLPKKCNGCNRNQLEKMGIKFGEDADDLFVYVTLPDGWKKVATDHSMWSNLIDNMGRIRASIFYKAAFYDRDAFINLKNRYSYGVIPINGWSDPDYDKNEWHSVVTDDDKVLIEIEKVSAKPDYNNKKLITEWYQKKDIAEKLAGKWLEKHYPKYNDPLAYWD
jgi:hypothetical protein